MIEILLMLSDADADEGKNIDDDEQVFIFQA